MSDGGPVPRHVREEVFERADYGCEVCPARGTQVGGEATLHLHHRLSLEDGGTHEPGNLTVLCRDCHHHHHSGRTDPDDVETNLAGTDIDPTPADYKLINAIERVAPATTGELAKQANISNVHALRRLYALAAVDIVSMTSEREWDLADRVEDPLRGELPDNPERAARHARDDMIRRFADESDLTLGEIARIVGLDERTIPIAINRARAFDPPIPPAKDAGEPDLADLANRIASLERQVEADG